MNDADFSRTDAEYMDKALALAVNAVGRTSPNPLVGAVIVKDGRIVGAGWHRQAGTPHAEIHALNMAGELANGATVYVTLEPCSHYGKTGPCAKALIEAGVKRVVAATVDPNPKVAGKGLAMLKEAGIEVAAGLREREANRQNEVFRHWINTGRPFMIWKTAMSLDGKIAAHTGASRWITGEAAREDGHRLRDIVDGIMVGIGTLLMDDPALTCRLPDGSGKNPVRIVVDSCGRIPLHAKVLTDGASPVILAVTDRAPEVKLAAIRKTGAEVIVIPSIDGRVDLTKLAYILGERKITSLLVEGGGTLAFSLLKAGFINKVRAYIAPKLIGGRTALTPLEGSGFDSPDEAPVLRDVTAEKIGDDICVTGYPVCAASAGGSCLPA